MTDFEIDQIIASDLQKIHDEPFPDTLPEWFLDNFKDIVMNTDPKQVPYYGETVEKIAAKKVSELTVYEGGLVCNMRIKIAPVLLGLEWDVFIEQKKMCDKIMRGFNTMMEREQKKLGVKKAKLHEGNRKAPNKILTPHQI